jgi:hypothetical protein
MIRLLEYGRDHEDQTMAARVIDVATWVAYYQAEELGWTPTDFLFRTIETGRTEGARGQALWRLISRATDPAIRGRLLALARAPVGPPAWRDLPVSLVESLTLPGPDGAVRMLWDDIHQAPELVRHPLARWLVECGSEHRGPVPRDDPCHPRNAPPRGGGQGG